MEEAVWLTIQGVDPSVWAYRVKARRQTIGRAPDCEIRLPDDTVSRRHAQIWRRGRLVFVRDLDSLNGTFVDGKRLTRCALASGRELRLGDVVVEIVVRHSSTPAADLWRVDSTTVARKRAPAAVEFKVGGLSDGERQVLRLLAQGLSEKRAAARLSLSYHTVHTHVKHIHKQLGVRSRAELMAVCLSQEERPRGK